MTYGTADNVAVLVKRYANSLGEFDAGTTPTETQVENWLDQVSAVLDIALAAEGFSIPITDANVTPALDLFVNQEVAAIVEGVHGSGRFGPTLKPSSNRQFRMDLILNDVVKFVDQNKIGLENLGATRTQSNLGGIAYRTVDEDGDTVNPLFTRKETYE